MAFLFSKNRRRSSVEQPERSSTLGNRKPSLDVATGDGSRDTSATLPPVAPTAGTKIGSLKQKLTSRSILNVSSRPDDPTSPTTPTKRHFSLSGRSSSPTASSPNSPTAAYTKSARRSSLAASALPQVPPSSSERLANATGSSEVYPPGTTDSGDVTTPFNENAVRRSSDVYSSTTTGTRAGLNDTWRPIEPDRRPIVGTPTKEAPVRPAVSSGGTSDSSTLPITPDTPVSPSTSYPARNPSSRPEIGKISIPPPHLPSRLASSSHFRDSPAISPGGWASRTPVPGSARTPGGTGWGMTIVPSTPLPRPIANLPTLNPQLGSASGSRTSSRPSSSTGFVNGYGFPVIPHNDDIRSEEGTGANRSGSTATSPIRGVEASPAEIRRAKKHMPVMLREPSHQAARSAPEPQEDSDDDGDEDDDSSSEEGSGENSSDSDTETEEAVPSASTEIARDRIDSTSSTTSTSSSVSSDDTPAQADVTSSLGNAGSRGLLHSRPRQASGSHPGHAHRVSVSSITEENEEDGSTTMDFGNYNMATLPMQMSAFPATGNDQQPAILSRRQVDPPRLSLPSLDSAEPGPIRASWNLATPSTPKEGTSSFFATSALTETSQWTSFGAPTPTSDRPTTAAGFVLGPEPDGPSPSESAPVAEPPGPSAGFEPDATPNASTNNANAGYFDSASLDATNDRETVTGGSGRVTEEVSTPKPRDVTADSASTAPAVSTLATPLADLNLGAAVGASRSAEDTETTPPPQTTPTIPEPRSAFAVLEHATADDEPVLVNTLPAPAERLDPAVTKVTRPSFYKQASRSMVNLSAREPGTEIQPSMPLSAGMDRTANASMASNISGRPPSGLRTPASARSSADWTRPPPTPGVGMMQPFKFLGVTEPQQSPKQMVQNRQLQALGPSPLKRRRSMDDVHAKLPEYAPPAKGIFLPRPREEEGNEKLPEYFCHVHIEGYLPRKMEFTAPGVQARDRSWKRQYFVVHGTALSVFKHDIHKVPLKPGDPHTVPEVDEADYDNLHVHRPGEMRRGSLASTSAAAVAERRPSPVPTGGSPSVSRRGSVDAAAATTSREGLVAAAAARRASVTAGTTISTSATNGPDAKERALFTSPSNSSTNSGGRRASVSSSQPVHPTPTSHANIAVHLPFHGSNSLIKQYTLQNAESGLAADYVKKRNVVRVRVEGEQFLLQTESAKDVVDWIEAFQAGTNVALDLDSRPMPKIITLPRRRRRRRPGEPAPSAQQTGVPNTEDTPEGNARAVAEAERLAAAARDRNIDDMERMLAEDQAA